MGPFHDWSKVVNVCFESNLRVRNDSHLLSVGRGYSHPVKKKKKRGQTHKKKTPSIRLLTCLNFSDFLQW